MSADKCGFALYDYLQQNPSDLQPSAPAVLLGDTDDIEIAADATVNAGAAV